MAAFHKPKVYRSAEGCCICKAKSSSSRFTASAKYEKHFESCFHLNPAGSAEEGSRGDEICNACVLLVKRYNKLPEDCGRHWAHVVDARAGPGVKNFVKIRRRERCKERALEREYKKKHVWRRKNKTSPKIHLEGGTSPSQELLPSGFLDPQVWRPKEVCCGTIFVNEWGEAVVDKRFLRLPCKHGRPVPRAPATSNNTITPTLPLPSAWNETNSSFSHSRTSSFSSSSSSISPSSSSSLMTIEKIIESELLSFEMSEKPKEQQLADVKKVEEHEMEVELEEEDRAPGDPDPDEGFFDKPSVSPVSSIEEGRKRREELGGLARLSSSSTSSSSSSMFSV